MNEFWEYYQLKHYQLKGKVKEYLLETFNVSKKTGNVITDYCNRKFRHFNKQGMLTAYTEQKTNGHISTRMEYIYDKRGNLIESSDLDEKGNKAVTYSNEFDDQDRIITKKMTGKNGFVYKTGHYTYDKEDLKQFKEIDSWGKTTRQVIEWKNPETNVIEDHYYNEEGKLHLISWKINLDNYGSVEIFSLDQNRKLINKNVYLRDKYGNDLEHREVFGSEWEEPKHNYYTNDYDEKNNLVSKVCKTGSGRILFKRVYIYDNYGNIIEEFDYIPDNKPIDDQSAGKLVLDTYEKSVYQYYY